MFELDFCLCGNSDQCPHKDECMRNIHLVGIHTYSLFYKENEECEYFIPRKNEEVDKNA